MSCYALSSFDISQDTRVGHCVVSVVCVVKTPRVCSRLGQSGWEETVNG